MSTTHAAQNPRPVHPGRSRSSHGSSSHVLTSHPPSRSSTRYPALAMASQSSHDDRPLSRDSSPSVRRLRSPLTSRQSLRKSSMASVPGDRPPTPVSKSTTAGKDSSSTLEQGPRSALLQEKLQRERRSEIQRNLSRLAGETGASTIEPSDSAAADAAAATPPRPATFSAEDGDATSTSNGDDKKRGPGLKEMEQTMTTLHKQNFDLKLELFHRRERQTVLEERIETLEAEKMQAKQSRMDLIRELEQRDKAIEEAVEMIVSLEARIDLLLRDQKILQQLQTNGNQHSNVTGCPAMSGVAENQDKPNAAEEPQPGHQHELSRMPSFLTEHTDRTENLRNVYLNNQESLVSLMKTDSRVDNHGFVSPSMSVLSETSFPSIYGQAEYRDFSVPTELPRSFIYKPPASTQRSVSMPTKGMATSRIPSRTGADRDMSKAGSTLSPLRDVDNSPSLRKSGLESGPLADKEARSMENLHVLKPLPFPIDKIDKENWKRKPTTNNRSSNQAGLPPTPDTMTSSMLNHGRVSEDTQGRSVITNGTVEQHEMPRPTVSRIDVEDGGQWRFQPTAVAQPPSVTAFTGRQESSVAAYYEHRLPAIRRPRSADETTISRFKNDWDSGSEADEICSDTSSFDYWMREGLRPSQGSTARPPTRFSPFSAMQSRGSPDLFSFPSDGDVWQSRDMFGAMGGNGHLANGIPLSGALDMLDIAQKAATSKPQGPVHMPDRRSSLHAHVSLPNSPQETHTIAPVVRNERMEITSKDLDAFQPGTSDQSTAGWVVSQGHNQTAWSAAPVDVQGQQRQPDNTAAAAAAAAAVTITRHYPPHASQPQSTSRPRSRGLTRLFRRSLGSTAPRPQLSVSVPPETSPFPPPAASKDSAVAPAVGVPTWEYRSSLVVDEDMSATPPPIMRKRIVPGTGMSASATMDHYQVYDGGMGAAGDMARNPTRSATMPTHTGPGLGTGLVRMAAGVHNGGVPLHPDSSAGARGPQEGFEQHDAYAPQTQQHQNHHHTQGRRWFHLGRVTSLKHGAV